MTPSSLHDPDAFGALVTQYQRRLFGLVLMVVRNPAGAEEVTQDAFVRAYDRLDHYDERHPFYPWLATIAVRLAQNWLRGLGRRRAAQAAYADAGAALKRSADPVERLLADERDRLLWNAVAALPTGERSAVIMHYRQEMTVAEVATALGVTQGTVKSFLFRARRKLRQFSALEAAFSSDTEPRT